MRKMIPAVIMLLISAMLVGTSTYAWFSMNKTVTVTGMTVKAKGTDNVMIAETNSESAFAYGLNQTRTGNLQPASSIDGVDYFYTTLTNVKADGTVRNATYTQYSEATTAAANTTSGKEYIDSAFNTNYGITSPAAATEVYAYIDYSFYIKATNAAETAQNLRLSRCNLLYNNAAIASDAKAWRVAIFAKSTTAGSSVSDDVAVGNLTSILALSGAHYFSYAGDSTEKAVDDAPSTLAAVTNFGSAATLASINAGTTAYYKVTVRLWLEGEDTTCKNETFASLTKDWSLDLAFSLDGSAGVTAIGTVATTLISGSGNSRTAALNTTLLEGETAASYAWYKVGSPDAIADGTNNAAEYTASATGDYYCVITTQKGSKYRTATETITYVAP